MSGAAHPGDDLVPDAHMVLDRRRVVEAPPGEVWPWLVQLGKGRAGWYLPRSWERFVPRERRAARRIDPRWQHLAVGDRVDDYGRDGWFDVAVLSAPTTLVYTTERHGTRFSWALLLGPHPDGTTVHLRFRGGIRSTGLRARAIVAGADLVDRATTWPMLAGLAERVEAGR